MTDPTAPASKRMAPPPFGVAFLLAQLGSHATRRFAERASEVGLTPPQAGLLRAIGARPGQSQQTLATLLGVQPSRAVAFVDDLEERGLVERRRSSTDRRVYELHLTDKGKAMLQRVSKVSMEHEREITVGMSDDEKRQLLSALQHLADNAGLTRGIHPGYKDGAESPSKPFEKGKISDV